MHDIRQLNRAAVITELLRSRPVSRRRIARTTGISQATVSRAIDALMAEGIVREVASVISENPGRRPVLLDLAPDLAHVVGVDVGASNSRFVEVDLIGSVVSQRDVPTPQQLAPEVLAQWVVGQVRELCGERGDLVRFAAVGLPGAVSQLDDSVTNAPNLRQVEDPRFCEALRVGLGVPVEFDNDANYALLGEQRFGAARSHPTAAMLTLGAGLGGGLAVDGVILRGHRGLVGEFGHLPVGPLGTRLEHMVTGPGLMRRAAEAGVRLDDPASLFVPGAAPAVQALRAQFDQALLVVLTAITVSCEPGVIVLGGGIAKSLTSSLSRYEDALAENLGLSPRLVLPETGDLSGAIGAAVAGLHKVYEELGVQAGALTSLPS